MLFCETSPIFDLDNIKNAAILRDLLSNWQHPNRSNSARPPQFFKLTTSKKGLVPMRFAIFPVHVAEVLRLPRKSDARSYEVLHLSRKITLANLKIWCPKMQPVSGNQRPDLLTSLMNKSLVHSCNAPATENVSLQIRFTCPTPAIVFWKCYKTLTFCSLLKRCSAQSLAPATRNDIYLQQWPENGVFCTFWLGNVLRATTACNFSSLIWPDGSAFAALASLLFDPPEPQTNGKTQWIAATFLPFRAPASSFFSDLLSSSLLLSHSSHLCFSTCPYCHKFDF